jgi:hypothetical protein
MTGATGQQSLDGVASGGGASNGAPGLADGADAPPNRSTNLGERILQSIEDLVTLNIDTIVNDDGTAKIMTSTINLIDGDIKTEFDVAFVTGDLKELRDYHTQREAQGHQIIKDNIDALAKLIDLFSTAKSSIDGVNPPARPA